MASSSPAPLAAGRAIGPDRRSNRPAGPGCRAVRAPPYEELVATSALIAGRTTSDVAAPGGTSGPFCSHVPDAGGTALRSRPPDHSSDGDRPRVVGGFRPG